MAYQFKAHIMIHGQITCLTGLHIGGSEEQYVIGGSDHPVIRDSVSGTPYIPGSSLKGKMRSLLEWMLGKIEPDGSAHGRSCQDPACAICRIFGSAASGRLTEKPIAGPTRLLVRDAFASAATQQRFQEAGVFGTEQRPETRLNRITAEATTHLMERVPRGAQFEFEMLYGIYDLGDGGRADVDNLKYLYTTFDLLEAGALGSGGSRGSGKISLENLCASIKSASDYQAQAAGAAVELTTITGRQTGDLLTAIRGKLGLAEQSGVPAS